MSLRKDNSGLFACPQESNHGNPFRYCPCGWMEPETKRYNNKPQIPRSTLENALAALLKRTTGNEIVTISIEEIIDAPDIEIRQDFERDVYEFRIR